MARAVQKGFAESLAEEYADDGYDVVAVEEEYPGVFFDGFEGDPIGSVDLLLEDRRSAAYRVVGALEADTVDPGILEPRVSEKRESVEDAVEYFDVLLEEDVRSDTVVKTGGELNSVRQLLEKTTGVFTEEQAREAVLSPGVIDSLKSDGHLLRELDASAREDRDYYEFSPQLERVVDMLREVKTYP